MEEDLPKPVVIRIKRKYTRRPKPNAEAESPTPLPILAKDENIQSLPPVPPVLMEPTPSKMEEKEEKEEKEVVEKDTKSVKQKPKRKYTKRQPGELTKPKRKYTRRTRPSQPTSAIIPEEKATPILDISPPKKDIKLSPKTPIMIHQVSSLHSVSSRDSEKPRLNETYIELMKDLAFVMRHNKDFMRARAYDNARATIEGITEPIYSPEQLRGKPGIGKTIYQKLVDFIERGTLNVLENPANKAALAKKRTIDVFLDIYGIGEKKAEELVDRGILSIDQLREQQDQVLNEKQKIGLKYYHDILQRIPRSEIEDYENLFRQVAPASLQIQIVGSYRRGLPTSGDIDAILTSQTADDFKVFVDRLIENQTIVEVLSRGPSKCLVVAKLPWAQYARRVDFLYTTPQEFPFSILYFTGSKGFNTAMREHALKLGMTLNEHGFSAMEGRKKGAAITREFLTERAIFDFLNLEYKDPRDRVDGSTVVVVGSQTQSREHAISESTPPPVPAPSPAPIKVLKAKTIKPRKMETATRNIEDFKTNGIKVLENLSEKDLVSMVEKANEEFHTVGNPTMTDAEYDILREFIEQKYPKNVEVKKVGAEVITKNKAVLPYEMASMDKIKPDSGALLKWMQKFSGPYVISCKLDGVSGLYTTENPREPKLYTRGDGKIGQDVSYLIPYLKLPKTGGVVIRGEFIIKRRVFEEKYKDRFSNSRNLVAGIVNAKTVDDKIRDVDFVAYEVIKPDNMIPSLQMKYLENTNIDVVKNMSVDTLSNESLSEVLQKWRDSKDPENLYEIDGIIVSDDKVYPRASGNPEHSFAFKMVLSDQIAETHVLDVEWNVSKDGYLKPRVRVSEVELSGVKINYVTGINGAFIEKNGIGIGAIVRIIRSGDVIPKIEAVVTPAETPKMPSVPYRWNATHIDLVLEGEDQTTAVREKQIAQFFKGIEVDGLGPGNVAKIVKAGYDSICKVLAMKEDDFMRVEGFQKKTAEKLANGIAAKVDTASLATIMAASNQFGRGFGIERIELILKEYPTVLDQDERNLAKLKAVKGIAEKTAKEFLENIPKFMEFLKECGLEYKLDQVQPQVDGEQVEQPLDISHPLYGKSIVMTGFRDKELETKLKQVGAKLGSSVSKNTFAVLVKTMEEETGKVADATRLGVTIMTAADFIAQFFT